MNRSRLVGIVVMVASVLAVLLAVNSTLQSSAYARCQSRVTEALIRSSTARAAAAEQDRQSDVQESAATAELIRTVFTVQTAAERIEAYATYRKALDTINAKRAATEKQRKDNPLPAPPSQTCG
jgi:hypothetical protein